MAKEYSPFTPGVPVPVDFFVGRIDELKNLIDKAEVASQGRLERVFVYGERGIGKSSFCNMARTIAEKKLDILGVHVFLGGVSSLQEMVRRLFEKLLNDNVTMSWYEKVKSFLGSYVKEVGFFGVNIKFDLGSKELEELVNNFATVLKNLLKSLGGEKKGFMIVLDDLNGLAASAEFANWLKSFVDEISTGREKFPLLLILAGLPERRVQLFQAQPSLTRVFDPIEIKKLSKEETENFYQQSFVKVGMEIDKNALDMLWKYSGGYPVLAHEIGDAVFKIDTDNHINYDDALDGILKAADVIGQKYIEPQVYDAVRSLTYHSILHKLSKELFQSHFKRKEMVKDLTEDEKKAFDNFLRRMKQLGVLVEDKEAGAGAYKFTSDLHYLFFWLQARQK